MALIDKDTLVLKIEKRIKETESMQPKFDQFWAGQISAFKGVLKILDTLEVKEVDIEKKKMEWIEQLCKYFKANYLYVSGHESFISDFRMYAKNLK